MNKPAQKVNHQLDVVYVETRNEILDPVVRGPKSNRRFFLENRTAQALWILIPGAREPYRVSWRRGLGLA